MIHLTPKCVTHVSERVSPLSPVHTQGEGQGEGMRSPAATAFFCTTAVRLFVCLLAILLLAAPLLAADKLRLNQATQEQLLALGLTQSQAAQIVRYRTENGSFLQVEELLAVPQISREVFDKVHEKVTVDE